MFQISLLLQLWLHHILLQQTLHIWILCMNWF